MSKNLLRFSSIAFALSLGLGIPGQARATNSGCDGRSTIHRKPDDVLSGIAWLFRKKCNATTEKITAKKRFIPPTPAKPVSSNMMIANDAPVISTLAPMPVHAPIIPPAADNAPVGRYEIELAPNQVQGIAVGQFPALSLADQTKKGFWHKRERTVATVVKTQSGNFVVNVEFRTLPSAHSAIAIDLGSGNLVHIGGEVIARDGRIANANGARPKRFARKKYASLNAAFLKQPSFPAVAARKVIPIALPTVAGFFALGPVGAAIGGGSSIARSFVTAKIMSQQMPPSEMAPHVQHILANQADQIGALEAKMVDLQKQITSLATQARTDRKPTTSNNNEETKR